MGQSFLLHGRDGHDTHWVGSTLFHPSVSSFVADARPSALEESDALSEPVLPLKNSLCSLFLLAIVQKCPVWLQGNMKGPLESLDHPAVLEPLRSSAQQAERTHTEPRTHRAEDTQSHHTDNPECCWHHEFLAHFSTA